MKFLPNIIQISSCLFQNLADPCGAPDIPESSHRLFFQYSRLHSQLPIGDDPNNVCPEQGTLVGEDAMNDLSVFSQVHLYSMREDIPRAYGCGPCSRHLSGHERSPNRISVPKGLDSGAAGHPLEHHSGISSPILYGNSDYLSNGNSYGTRPCHKTKTFIETKVTAMKLQGFNL